MHELVDGDSQDDRNDEAQETNRVLGRSLHRGDEATADKPVQQQEKTYEEQGVDRAGSRSAQASCDHS